MLIYFSLGSILRRIQIMSSDLGFESKIFFAVIWRYFWFGFVDPHIFADPDPGSHNDTDPTDPDPKHYLKQRQGGLLHLFSVLGLWEE